MKKSLKEDGRVIRKLLVKYGYEGVLNMIDNNNRHISELSKKYETELEEMVDTLHRQMDEDLKTIFQFAIIPIEDKDYILLNNLISFLLKIEPYIDEFDIDSIKIKAVTIKEQTYIILDDLIEILDTLNGYTGKFDLKAVADYIIEKSRNI